MKKLMVAAAIVCAATAAQAEKSYGIMAEGCTVQAYSKDTDPGTAHGSWYSLYVMKYEDAQAAMGVETSIDQDVMATWLSKNFAANKASIIANSQSIGSGTYSKERFGGDLYKFSLDGATSTSDISEALGVYFYNDGKNVAYNVVQNNGSETFHFQYDNRQSGWTAVTAVPEPTSGLLMLMGGMLLGLRRKRA